ncbi:MAG: dihydropteroate synthase [Bacteroidetes bacterium]|jgi:dihydropteroate synthase|nr:dihydropteroate synthase [Bacteroidota bacterium]
MPDVAADPLRPERFDADRFVLDCRGRALDCRPGQPMGAHVMGILNVTPDSFSDGGQFLDADDAVARAAAMHDEGATIIDVGGESTRPAGSVYGEGAAQVAREEELDRVRPVIEGIVERVPEALISVDTYKPAVARAALEAGAHIVNDITGLRHYPETAAIAATYGAPLVVMHSLGRPGAMPHTHAYDDVTGDVKESLESSLSIAEAAGVPHIITDPGFGFGKTTAENLRLINRVDALLALDRPVLVGISRKSTIGAVLGTNDAPAPIGERLYGSLGATAVAVMRGATIVRTHDVQPTVEMLRAMGATLQER